jgi:hypothetical protein
MDIFAGPAPDPIPDDPLHLARFDPIKHLRDLPPPEPDSFPPSPLPNILLPMASGAGGGGGIRIEHHIKVVYQPGVEQSEIEVHQQNIMFNDVTMLPAGAVLPDGQALQLDTDTMATIKQMADDANAHIPSDWWIPQNGTGAADFLNAHDANWAANGGMPDAHSVQPGYYLNGVLQDPATPPPDQTPLAAPAPLPDTGHGLGQWGGPWQQRQHQRGADRRPDACGANHGGDGRLLQDRRHVPDQHDDQPRPHQCVGRTRHAIDNDR